MAKTTSSRTTTRLSPLEAPLTCPQSARLRLPAQESTRGRSPAVPLTVTPINPLYVIRRASSVSSRSDASGSGQHEYRFVQPAPHAGPGSASGSASTPAPGKVQWPGHRTGIPCAYESPIPDFVPCTRTFSRVADMRRHIDHQHCEEEAQAVIDGRLDRKAAKLLGEDWKGKISKPTCEGW
jgi:hypothetical protein